MKGSRHFSQLIGVTLTCHLLLVFGAVQAQNVSINDNGAPPDSSAMLDVSSTTKGFLAPRMTQSQRNGISNPATGLLIYQTDNSPGYRIYDGSSWAAPGSAFRWNITGNSSTSPSSDYLGTSDAVDFVIRTNATERMRIESGGSVGIGTSGPVNLLDVAGAAVIGTSYSGSITAPSNGLLVEGFMGVGVSSATQPLMLAGSGGSAVGITQSSVGGSATMELTTSDGSNDQATRLLLRGAADDTDVEFYTGASGSEAVTLFIEGTNSNVGIGTSTPANRLDVEGGMAIGSTYSGTSTAPTNGLLVEGQTRIGTNSFSLPAMFEVENNSFSWASIIDQNYSGSSANFGQYIDVANTGTAAKFGQYIDMDATSGSTNSVYGSYAYMNATSGSSIGYFVEVNTAGSNVDYGFYAIGEEQNYFSGNLSLGSLSSTNKLDVEGGAAIGASFSGNATAPSNGLIVEGNVGIGENNPQTSLDVVDFAVIGNLSVGSQSTDQASGNSVGLGFLTTPWLYTNAIEAQGERGSASTLLTLGDDGVYGGGDEIHLVTAGNSRFMVDSDGEIGAGTSDPLRDFHIVHKSGGSNDGLGLENASGGSDIWHLYTWLGNDLGLFFNGTHMGSFDDSDGSYSTSSDIRLKKNIATKSGLLNEVMQLRVAEYHFLEQDESSPKEIGFIAQEVLPLFPHLINQPGSEQEGGTAYYAMDYAGVSALAIGAIQEQQQIISSQEDRITQMEEQIQQLMIQMQQLQSQINR